MTFLTTSEMAHESSLSKGCFIRKPKQCVDPFVNFKKEIWDEAFTEVWSNIESNLKVFNDEISSQLMDSLINFCKSAESVNCKIPTAVLLTGVNLPDHSSLFSRLVLTLMKNVNSAIAMLHPSSCSTLKNTVETMAGQFINNESKLTVDLMDEDDSEEEETAKACAKNACNMPNLVKWYNSRSPSKKNLDSKYKLIVIIPDFEGMSPKVLHGFLLILSCYVNQLPLVVILGVATSASVIGDILEHSVTSKLSVQVFQSQRSVHILNNVLDNIFLTKDCPLQLGPKIFKFLMNTFLFYDFSVQKFTLGIKYCIMDHFLQQPFKILCTNSNKLECNVNKLTENDLDCIRMLDSFKAYLETLEESERNLLCDSSHFKNCIVKLLKSCHKRLEDFYLNLRLLQIVICELPGAPLGKQMRELYLAAMSGDISKSSEYKECIQFMKFQGKDNLLDTIYQLISHLSDYKYEGPIKDTLIQFKTELEDLDSQKQDIVQGSPNKINMTKNRNEFKEAMAALSKKKRYTNFEDIRERLINFLMKEVFPAHLEPVTSLPLYEIIVCDTTRSSYLKRYLVGCPRGDVHHALIQPKDYLMCECCKLEDPNEIPASLPDICIVYKLHLECGALINLHDWLQSFSSIIDPESAKDDIMEISPLIQARFMQAVSDLEFMGFIKSSKRKADHVSRMTWGGTA